MHLCASFNTTDHFVILGNHRDAWTFGAVDPNSGTATLMEIARILADMKGKGNQLTWIVYFTLLEALFQYRLETWSHYCVV